jgi:hypothetical protein
VLGQDFYTRHTFPKRLHRLANIHELSIYDEGIQDVLRVSELVQLKGKFAIE